MIRVRAILVALLVLSACTAPAATGTKAIPDDFPSLEQLAGLVGPFSDEIDAQISSSIAMYGDEEDLAALGVEAGVLVSMTITYFGDLTVWDYPDGVREVKVVGEYLYRADDGTWQESERFEWPPFGPLPEWHVAQVAASSCLEADPDLAGSEEVAGVVTVHVSCGGDTGSIDVWLDKTGVVMKLVILEPEPDTSLRLETVWEVTSLNIEPEGPLPGR